LNKTNETRIEAEKKDYEFRLHNTRDSIKRKYEDLLR